MFANKAQIRLFARRIRFYKVRDERVKKKRPCYFRSIRRPHTRAQTRAPNPSLSAPPSHYLHTHAHTHPHTQPAATIRRTRVDERSDFREFGENSGVFGEPSTK